MILHHGRTILYALYVTHLNTEVSTKRTLNTELRRSNSNGAPSLHDALTADSLRSSDLLKSGQVIGRDGADRTAINRVTVNCGGQHLRKEGKGWHTPRYPHSDSPEDSHPHLTAFRTWLGLA